MNEPERRPIRSIGVLTGGGDCPGLNAVIRAVVKTAHRHNYSVIGIRNGWKGIVEGKVEPLTDCSVTGILPKGGTILGTSRTNPFKNEEDVARMLMHLEKFGIDVLIAIGGDDTLSVAARLHQMGVRVIGIPKTIDNDLSCTDYTFGFDTAVSIVTDAIDRLHTTAESHQRIMVLEVMGRHAGWIATFSGIAGGADQILIPEVPFDLDEVCDSLRGRFNRGKTFSIVVVAEGAKPKEMSEAVTASERVDEFGHEQLGGIGQLLGKELERRLGVETRVTVLGHVQRGGSPTAHDRVLASRFGVKAIEQIAEGNFGVMVAQQGDRIVPVPLADVCRLKTVDMDLFNMAKIFF
jgi:phosphofructokinase-like protein